ncbi:hypothetical protein ACSX1C_14190 [Pseudomonas sp. MBLB4123]|uniref:hypothetical protein n=1 Tax=Pseudomonas sp. MBLB4123 TaxID=3451557 RepID=UPI003F754397
MRQERIRLYANNVHYTDGEFDRFEPLVGQPSTHQGKVYLACVVSLLGLFAIAVVTGHDWLAAITLLAAVIVPFLVLHLLKRGIPDDEIEVYAEQSGLLLVFKCGRFPELSTDIRIPFVEIDTITLESKVVYEARLGPHRWRQYRVKTSRTGDTPHVLINTFRPLNLVIQDLQRLSALPDAERIDIQLIAEQEEIAALSTP